MSEETSESADVESMAKQAVKKVFGSRAAAYVKSVTHANGEDLRWLIDALAIGAEDVALDVATGGGHVANGLAQKVHTVVALDLTQPMLNAAQRHSQSLGLRNVVFVTGDAEALPFADQSFDAVTCRLAAHHFPDPERFLNEVARVLKPGGYFGLADNVAPEEPRAEAFINHVEKLRDLSHGWCPPISVWKQWLTAGGFECMREKTWPKLYAFETWVARTAETLDQQEAVAQALRSASDDLAQQFSIIREKGRIISFQTVQWAVICRRLLVPSTSSAGNG
jgi:ubiquinone/menaquinone biosynthesis C-methylase UbiE